MTFCVCPQGVLRMLARCFVHARKVVSQALRPCQSGFPTLSTGLSVPVRQAFVPDLLPFVPLREPYEPFTITFMLSHEGK